MSELTIDIDSYLTEEDKRSIAREEFREVCRQKSREDFERILKNSAYDMVRLEVDAAFDGKMVETVKENAVKIISELSSYSVFTPPSAWERAPSKGWENLQKAVEDNRDRINERVQTIIEGYQSHELRELIEERLVEAIVAKLKA